MDRRTLVALGLTVGLVTLVLASMANSAVQGEYVNCAHAGFGLLFMSPMVALLGAFACTAFLAARGAHPVAYILLLAALPIVAGSVYALIVGLSEACSDSGGLASGAATGALVATPTLVAAVIGLAAGYVLGRLVRWIRGR